jgi:DNA replication and repair protein RecF
VARTGKRLRVNGIPRRAADFVGQLRAVLFTADDLDIISGAPSGRRQYIDAALSQLDRAYYAALQRYGRIIQQRNASLRRIREGIAGNDELALWDDSFTHEGATIIAARCNALSRLAPLATAAHTELSGARETLDLAYEPQLGEEWSRLLPENATAATVQPLFAAALAAQRRREVAAGVSLVGPHRDDISIRLNGASAASFGSRAQIRTAALALRLAEARLLLTGTNDPPVLLLDDIVSELDEHRRETVLAGASGFDQVWFTATTGASLPADFLASAQRYKVEAGQVTPA